MGPKLFEGSIQKNWFIQIFWCEWNKLEKLCRDFVFYPFSSKSILHFIAERKRASDLQYWNIFPSKKVKKKRKRKNSTFKQRVGVLGNKINLFFLFQFKQNKNRQSFLNQFCYVWKDEVYLLLVLKIVIFNQIQLTICLTLNLML
jgi:sterol desaturase/sphingolipid hydroxylase (fatty acid hydroxylase superfamily)